ncbi:hypothetical protein EVAR_32396_1 [Eumeta japonica]|uniref:Uncharacterized protein n=1 Tax=Eumeta variegata TaxID=151549 RepID=A0A4C1VJZ7_EUMVA|nr:hypothetical protein EVAR_32396_1 [Eumeta japonica]
MVARLKASPSDENLHYARIISTGLNLAAFCVAITTTESRRKVCGMRGQDNRLPPPPVARHFQTANELVNHQRVGGHRRTWRFAPQRTHQHIAETLDWNRISNVEVIDG